MAVDKDVQMTLTGGLIFEGDGKLIHGEIEGYNIFEDLNEKQ